MTEWTRGPWREAGRNVRDDGIFVIAGDYGICSVWDLGDRPENKANARLIAAAPTMAEAAAEVVRTGVDIADDQVVISGAAYRAIRAAVALAKGSSND